MLLAHTHTHAELRERRAGQTADTTFKVKHLVFVNVTNVTISFEEKTK